MKLTLEGIKDCELWNKAGITLPGYDVEKVSQKAKEEPKWVHFGIGNIFRIFIGGIADGLVGEGHRVAGDKRQIAVLSVIIVVDGGDAVIAGDGCHHRAVFHDLVPVFEIERPREGICDQRNGLIKSNQRNLDLCINSVEQRRRILVIQDRIDTQPPNHIDFRFRLHAGLPFSESFSKTVSIILYR